VVKLNRFDSTLSARMTDGSGVSGNWTTWGYGASAEVGRQITTKGELTVTPYVAISGYQNTRETVKLSNGMKAEPGDGRSVRGEAGVRLEKNLKAGKADVTPYVTGAVVQEFARSSDVKINDTWAFQNDFTGGGAKLTAGAAIAFGNETSAYIEASTGRAENTRLPVQASVGIRLSF
jgi:Autotransporter beta-domain.